MMLTGDGYTWRDLYDTADAIKKQLVLVPGVRKVVIDGEQREVVYLEVSRSRLAELGIDLQQIGGVLGSQNVVVDSGSVRVGDDYLRISPTGDFQSVQEIGDLLISSATANWCGSATSRPSPGPMRRSPTNSTTSTASPA